MKTIKGSVLFISVVSLISSCFNPPEFSVIPKISLNSMYYGQSTEADSIVVALTFQDRDGDLGFDATNPDDTEYPYNFFNYYLASNGTIKPIPASPPNGTSDFYFINRNGETGKLVTAQTRDDVAYQDDLPPYAPESCSYSTESLFVPEIDSGIIDPNTTDIVETGNPLTVAGTFYHTINPNYYNITIEILEQTTTGFKPIIFLASGCNAGSEFNARFPLLTKENDNVPLEGVLTYSIKSTGFQSKIGIRPFKIRIQIKDRALHLSNVIESKVVTLDKIRK